MTSREQFEAWFPSMVVGIPESMVKVFDEMLFMAWQASREAIEITLPEVYGEKYTPSSITMDGFDFERYLQDLYAAIELEDIKVKK